MTGLTLSPITSRFPGSRFLARDPYFLREAGAVR